MEAYPASLPDDEIFMTVELPSDEAFEFGFSVSNAREWEIAAAREVGVDAVEFLGFPDSQVCGGRGLFRYRLAGLPG